MHASPPQPLLGLLADSGAPLPGASPAGELPRLTTAPTSGLYLHWNGRALALCRAEHPPLRLQVDFDTNAQRRRRRQASPGGELLARACGLGRGHRRHVLDATGGVGRDAFLLATLGARVTVIERSETVAVLLADGLRRAADHAETAPIAERLTLIAGEARPRLQPGAADVVYLDPMYQAPGRKALAGKEMQLLQALLGSDDDADTLLAPALAAADQRVVVKRHRHAPSLARRSPHHSLRGRSTRFDVYLPAPGTR